MLSYWEKQSLLQYDYIILGSGIVGLSTAISIKEKHPVERVLVLEREILPTGASTKNAGFACIGSLTEILADLKNMPPEEVLDLMALRLKGLQLLRQRIGDHNMEYQENGSYELIGEEQLAALQQMDAVNELLYPVLGGKAYSLANDKIASFGFDTTYTQALVQNNYEGELHTGKMMRALIDIAMEKGVEIKTGCTVSRIEEMHTGVHVIVPVGILQEEVIFTCRHLAVCTNAFTATLLPELEVVPGRGQVLITEPIRGLPFTGIFHMEEGYYYFRELQGRVLFGGGRNLDFSGEATTAFAYNYLIQQELEEKLRTIILPHHPFKVADRWVGIMAFGATRRPIIGQHSRHIYLGVRMGGMGVAIGSAVGAQLAEMMA
jgi:gamma-glutamylputrescine oxidase